MKKLTIVLIIGFALNSVNAQKPLSKETIKDFAAVCWYNYRVGNSFFVVMMHRYLPYERSEVGKVMERLDTDHKAREQVLQVFNHITKGNQDQMFQQFLSLKLEIPEAKELATYAATKYSEKKSALFTGTKKFSDGEAWDINVTISGNKITIKSTPNPKNEYWKGKKNKPVEIQTGTIKDGKIQVKGAEYKYEDGVWYEMNNEGGWNDYEEIK